MVGEEKEAPAHLEQLWLDLWRTELDAAELEKLLTAQGVVEPAPLCAALLRFKEEYKRRQVGPQGRIALDWLMPELLRLVVASEQPARLFERVCELLTRIFHPQRLSATAGGKPGRPAPAGTAVRSQPSGE